MTEFSHLTHPESAIADKTEIKYLPFRKLMLFLSAILFLLSATSVGILIYNLMSINTVNVSSVIKDEFNIALGTYAATIVSSLGMAVCAILFSANVKNKAPLAIFALIAIASAVLYYLNSSNKFLSILNFKPASADITEIATLYAPIVIAAVMTLVALPPLKRTAIFAIIPAAVAILWAYDFYKFASFKYGFIEANKNILATRLFYCQLFGSFHTILTPVASALLILGIHRKENKLSPATEPAYTEPSEPAYSETVEPAYPEPVEPVVQQPPTAYTAPDSQQYSQQPLQNANEQGANQQYTNQQGANEQTDMQFCNAPMHEHQVPYFDDAATIRPTANTNNNNQ